MKHRARVLLLAAALLAVGSAATTQAQVVVRDAGVDDVHTYRIPALATTKAGTLLAAYDCRYDNSRDLQGHIDIGLSRSTDRGASWEPMRIVLDMGHWGFLPEKFNGVSDPCLLVDTVTGRVWVMALWMHGVLDKNGKFIDDLTEKSDAWQHQWNGRGSQPGLSPYQTSQFIMAYSDDDGQSWSEPIDITPRTKPYEWWLYAPAPGQGITMRDGTLVIPTQGRNAQGVPFSNITYSKDRGQSWITTNPATYNTSECAVVELSDSSLMLNIRDNRNHERKGEENGRAIFTTTDLGQSWDEHPTSHKALREPVCMASLHRHGNLLLFSNPDTDNSRRDMRIKWSNDMGQSWHNGPLLDRGDSFGYSCLTSIDPDTVGIIWEGSEAQLMFQAIPLKDITVPQSDK